VKILSATSMCPETEVANSDEAIWKNVEKKPPEELVSRQPKHSAPSTSTVVLET